MILLALAAASLAQWTGPRTEEYKGPGYFCGGGYAVHLTHGERALILPQGQAPQATRLVLSGGEVNILTGARSEPGPGMPDRPQPGRVVLPRGRGRVGRPPPARRRVLRPERVQPERVLQVRQQQLLVLLLVVQPEFDERGESREGRVVGRFEQRERPLIDSAAVGIHLGDGRA